VGQFEKWPLKKRAWLKGFAFRGVSAARVALSGEESCRNGCRTLLQVGRLIRAKLPTLAVVGNTPSGLSVTSFSQRRASPILSAFQSKKS